MYWLLWGGHAGFLVSTAVWASNEASSTDEAAAGDYMLLAVSEPPPSQNKASDYLDSNSMLLINV